MSTVAQEIRGPSAYGGGWRRFANLTWLIAITDYRLTYFGSALGYLWSLVRPLALFGVLYLVFSKFLKFGNDIAHYRDLLLLNIVLFMFFSEATGQA
ncbi:MAG: type transport system permease protein, partial [Thermoleophilaceae bacterium]|nr:type transport system permease protein [Thermoleophilaceae bacterium]